MTARRGLVILPIWKVFSHDQAKKICDSIYGIVGGSHIGFSGKDQRDQSIDALRSYNIEHFIPAHCTGPDAICRMRNALGEKVQFSHVGMTLEF